MCQICEKSHDTKEAMDDHYAKEHPHPQTIKETKHERKFKCEMCDNRYTQSTMMRKHMARKHGVPIIKSIRKMGQGNVKCDLCDKRYYFRKDLNRHKKDSHGIYN